ncbi:MAG: site-specific DNA-methyltransferase [Chloroflexi bacterium]|nr:site-specific DNA-methyltransferase [Chloroflexota bacterium]
MSINSSYDNSWDFSDVPLSIRQGGVHFFHHYTAKFIPQIPEKFITKYSHNCDVVLDPFMGSGTTLIVAKSLGKHSYGLDTNPLSIKIVKAKTILVNENVLKEIDDFLYWLSVRKENLNHQLSLFDSSNDDPNLFPGSELWFRIDVAKKLRSIINKYSTYSDEVKNFIEVGLSDLLKGMSNARMDNNLPTLPDNPIYIDRKHYYREVNNDTREILVYSRLFSQISRMKKAIIDFNKKTDSSLICKPIQGDARELSKYINSCDLVITSPPYWSAQNYQKLHCLSFSLFNLSINEKDEIGRNGHPNYQEDMEKVNKELAKVLKGYYGLVIGEDSKNNEHLKVVDGVIKAGFKLVDTFIRQISNQTFFSKQIKNEYIYVFKI